jgi:hypothetical protein
MWNSCCRQRTMSSHVLVELPGLSSVIRIICAVIAILLLVVRPDTAQAQTFSNAVGSALNNKPPQQNLWGVSGSGKAPRV